MGKQRLFSHQYRLYPTPEQEVFLNQTLGCVRKVFNPGLSEHKKEREIDQSIKWNGYKVVKKIWMQVGQSS